MIVFLDRLRRGARVTCLVGLKRHLIACDIKDYDTYKGASTLSGDIGITECPTKSIQPIDSER